MLAITPNPGDWVVVECAGVTRKGTVVSAHNYGTPENPCWYIEFNDPDDGPVYWKQDMDGGTLVAAAISLL